MERHLSRRSFLCSFGFAASMGIASALTPVSAYASARAVATGTKPTFSNFHTFSGQMASGASFSAGRYIDMYGTVTSWGAQFGPNSVRGRMYLQGTTGTSTTIQPYPYETVYGPATSTARFTHLYDVSGYPGLGAYDAFFWADLYIANMGWACLPVHSSLFISWGDYAAYSGDDNGLEHSQDGSTFLSEYVAATGDTGEVGYVKSADLNGPTFSTIDEMVKFYRDHDSRQIPVYDSSKAKVIDTYTILCGIE